MSTCEGAMAMLCDWKDSHGSGIALCRIYQYICTPWPKYGRWNSCLCFFTFAV